MRRPDHTRSESFLRECDGAAAAEFAIVISVLVTILFGLIECGRLLWTQSTLTYAVQQAARYYAVQSAAAGSDIAPSTVTAYAVTQAVGLNVSSSAFTAVKAACGQSSATNYQVSGAFTFQFVPTGLLPASSNLSTSACVP
jgi:Flp pilus assembly protein TadG